MPGSPFFPSVDGSDRLRVLGSVRVEVDGREVPIGGSKPRCLLALLTLRRGSLVAADQLMDALWGDDVPDTGVATLQSYVSRIRRLLPAGVQLTGQRPGYRLDVPRGLVDVDRFEDGVAAGVAALEHSPATAQLHLEQAVREWRGNPFAEFADAPWARPEIVRLSELRLQALEARLAALVALGQDTVVVRDAEAFVTVEPWRERTWIELMLALHRLGRQGDALRTANDYRIRLREDLGLEPSPEFVRLERSVASDTVAAGPATGAPSLLRARPTDHARPAAQAGPDLIGRDGDLAAIVEQSRLHRLLTLVGPGGIGKTQLALRTAAERTACDGLPCAIVELALVREEPSVIAAIATQLHVQPQHGRSVAESVLDVLSGRSLMLVLDNCEHVLDTVAQFAERLLRSCPKVTILATSRSPLALPVEQVFTVPPLQVAAAESDMAALIASPAVALFLERARAVNSEFRTDPPALRAVSELCRRLDGVPLAIELAAARTRSLSPSEIAERLNDRFTLLAGSSRVSDARHRSLRGLVDWSFQLLEPVERQLFGRLSVFAGSFDLPAAERVCADDDVPRDRVASLLAGLVDKSMVQAGTGVRTTYRLLESLREFGAEVERSEGTAVALRHAAWLLDICARSATGVHGPDERMWLDTLDGLFDDLRLTVRSAIDRHDLDTALGIVVAAHEHSFRRLHYELIGWAEAALAVSDADTHSMAAAAWGIVAYGRFVRGEIESAIELGERAVQLARAHASDALGLPERALGNAYVFAGDTERSRGALARMVDDAVASGVAGRVAHACYMRSLCETGSGGATTGANYAARATEAAAVSASPTARSQAAYACGIWTAMQDPAHARVLLEGSLRLAKEAGNPWLELFSRTGTLWLQAVGGQPHEALQGFAEVIAAWHRAGDWANQWLSLRHVLGICFLVHADELAAVIHGALERAGALNAFPFEPSAAAQLETMLAELRQRLGERAFTAAHRRGFEATTTAAIELIASALR